MASGLMFSKYSLELVNDTSRYVKCLVHEDPEGEMTLGRARIQCMPHGHGFGGYVSKIRDGARQPQDVTVLPQSSSTVYINSSTPALTAAFVNADGSFRLFMVNRMFDHFDVVHITWAYFNDPSCARVSDLWTAWPRLPCTASREPNSRRDVQSFEEDDSDCCFSGWASSSCGFV